MLHVLEFLKQQGPLWNALENNLIQYIKFDLRLILMAGWEPRSIFTVDFINFPLIDFLKLEIRLLDDLRQSQLDTDRSTVFQGGHLDLFASAAPQGEEQEDEGEGPMALGFLHVCMNGF